MPETLADIFGNDAFSVVEMTNAINVIPNRWGRIQQLGVFGPGRGVTTTTVTIERSNGVLNLLPSTPRGTPGTAGVNAKRDVRALNIPFIPHDDVVKAEEVQGVRAFGTGGQLETVQNVVNQKLLTMRSKHAITLEYLRAGALKGIVMDANGSTVLLNLFTEFGIAEKVVAFDLANAAADIDGKCMEVLRHIEDNLLGDTHTYVHALCSASFFDAFTKHAKVVDAYKFYQSQAELLRRDVRSGFIHKDILWEEYRGNATHLQADSTTITRPFIPAGDVRFFPMGTTQTFDQVYAPGDFLETVNTMGKEVYAKQVPERFNRWVDIHTQSSPLPYCMRPATLVRGHSGAP